MDTEKLIDHLLSWINLYIVNGWHNGHPNQTVEILVSIWTYCNVLHNVISQLDN